MKFLEPKNALRLLELAGQSHRPLQIIELQEKIEGEMRAAGLLLSATGIIDQARVQKIVAMKLDLDGLFIDWAEGKIT
jgi:hypothetical protein